MKKIVLFAICVACSVALACADTPTLNEKLAGTYCWSVPGSIWTLSLSVSGDYTLTTLVGFGKDARPIESGIWRYEGFTLVLKSERVPVGGSSEYRRLHVLQKKSGQLMLVYRSFER